MESICCCWLVVEEKRKKEEEGEMKANQHQQGEGMGGHLFEAPRCMCKIIWKAHILSLGVGKVGPFVRMGCKKKRKKKRLAKTRKCYK